MSSNFFPIQAENPRVLHRKIVHQPAGIELFHARFDSLLASNLFRSHGLHLAPEGHLPMYSDVVTEFERHTRINPIAN